MGQKFWSEGTNWHHWWPSILYSVLELLFSLGYIFTSKITNRNDLTINNFFIKSNKYFARETIA